MTSNDSESPIIRFVNHVFEHAIAKKASDIHFETFTDAVVIRLRVDGVLEELPSPDRHLGNAIISRIKTIAGLDLAERRLPQDGHVEIKYLNRVVDFRVSTLPTQYGESVVLRVLDKDSWHFDLNLMGIPENVLAEIRKNLHTGSGIILTTGPTGSGKTTTLYSALHEINNEEIKILTAEDPVEYEIDGIVQVNIRDDIGLSFEKTLRSFLRHDPDKILIGELRDSITAKIAIQAALTGHLVLGTLHTNDAPAAITRLVDMGIEPFLIADTIRGILAQRLLRKICENCKEKAPRTRIFEEKYPELADSEYYIGKGCPQCNNTGYSGRFGIYEWLDINAEIRQSIRNLVPLENLQKIALDQGLVPLKTQAIEAVKNGQTTIHELDKV
ncbi:MAG: GspE/PulE family protein [Puniceicoccales bacterium]|jgi:type IV pilus assembly protein PilB|nr:GspE/PulE family protein [Puniceicoccales bacterium]